MGNATLRKELFEQARAMKSGIIGGLVGGGIAGIAIGVCCYLANRDNDDNWMSLALSLLVAFYVSIVGLFGGFGSQAAALCLRYLGRNRHWPELVYDVLGGGLGGTFVGVFLGILGGLFWGAQATFHEPDEWLIAVGVAGLPVVLFSILVGKFGKHYFPFVILATVFATIPAAGAGYVVWHYLLDTTSIEYTPFFKAFFIDEAKPREAVSWLRRAAGGAILGSTTGCILGVAIGVGICVYRWLHVVYEGLSSTDQESSGVRDVQHDSHHQPSASSARDEIAETGEGRNAMTKKHVFLSYCRENKKEVARLRDELMAAGEPVWWAPELLAGQDWKHEIRMAMNDAYAVVLCMSKEAMARTKSGIYPEALDAIAAFREFALGSIFLIPIRLSDCLIPDIEIDGTRTLKRLQYVDLFPPSRRAQGFGRLVKSLQAASLHP